MKKIVKLIILVMCLMPLTGCVKDYKKSDIIAYVEKNYPILNKDGNSFIVSSNPIKVIDDEKIADYVWSVTGKINNKVFEFFVINDEQYSAEFSSNQLTSTFSEELLKIIENDIDLKGYKYNDEVFNETYPAEYNKDVDEKLLKRLNLSYQYYMNAAVVESYYKTKEDMKNGIMHAKEVLEEVDKLNYGLNIGFKLMCDIEYCDGDFTFNKNNIEDETKIEELYQKNLNEFIQTIVDYNYINPLTLFTKEEINNVLSNENTYKIYYSSDGTEKGNLTLYENHCAKYNRISFSTLYDILKDNNIKVYGNNKHYKFTNKKGDTYEISTSFNDYEYSNNKTTYKGYYYLKNGIKTELKSYSDIHIDYETIQEITGLKIVTKKG